MLARLLLVLFVLLAVPPAALAAPACHEHPTAMAGMAHRAPAPAKGMPAGMCVGCVAPATVQPPILTARVLVPALAPLTPLLAILVGTGTPPATPPPRRG